jgi:hypothetical protein
MKNNKLNLSSSPDNKKNCIQPMIEQNKVKHDG